MHTDSTFTFPKSFFKISASIVVAVYSANSFVTPILAPYLIKQVCWMCSTLCVKACISCDYNYYLCRCVCKLVHESCVHAFLQVHGDHLCDILQVHGSCDHLCHVYSTRIMWSLVSMCICKYTNHVYSTWIMCQCDMHSQVRIDHVITCTCHTIWGPRSCWCFWNFTTIRIYKFPIF